MNEKIYRLMLSLIPYFAMVIGLHVLGNAWISFLIYHGLVFIVVWNRTDLHRELIQGWNTKVGFWALGFGFCGGLLIYFLAPLAGIEASLINQGLGRLGLEEYSWILFLFYHALVNPWFEEILWRGKLADKSLYPVAGDFLFAGYHILVLVFFLEWPWIIVASAVLTSAGWLWRQIRRRHNGLILPVTSHIAADASIMATVYFLSLS